ncbi:MAG: InlB B-repeat-containing protein [Clostridia bacterium]|nr:InlB B-repeat-containing protein [Clostridia bacterium]
MIKKLLSIILCLVMVLSLVPANIFAADDATEPVAVQEEQLPEETPAAEEPAEETNDADVPEEGPAQEPAQEAEPADAAEADETAPKVLPEKEIADEPAAAPADKPASTEQPTEEPANAPAEEPTQNLIDKEYYSEDQTVTVKGLLPENTVVFAQVLGSVTRKAMLKSASRGINAPSVVGDKALNALTQDNIAAFYDIKLSDGDEEIQPTEPVTVTINNVNLSGNIATVYHILEDADAIVKGLEIGTVKPVTAGILYERANSAAKAAAETAAGVSGVVYVETISASVNNGTVSFKATSFSVYVIGEQGKERRTYNFIVNGETVSTQIVKNGEELIEPEHPQTAEHQEFVGWNTSADGSGTYQSFGTVTGITAEETVDLYAVFETVYYVTFYEEDNTTVLETRKAKASNNWTVDISDLKVIPESNVQGFFGWSLRPNDTVNIDAETYTTNDHDVDLYPVIADGYWLRFDENDGGTGGGASYTPPKFYRKTENTVAPEDPTRKGYRFDGWYTGAPSQDGQDPTGTRYGFNARLTQDTTLYAKWVATASSYSIIIWKQQVTDTVGMADAEKSYDFEGSVVFNNVATGSTVSVPQDPYRNYAGQENVQIGQNENTSNFIGFHLGRYDGAKQVLGDGSTVLNVYYDRNVITINFDYPADSGQSQQTIYVEDPNGDYYFYNDPWDSGYYEGGTGPTPNAPLTHHQGLFGWSTFQIYVIFVGYWPSHTHYQYTNQSKYYPVGTGPDPSAPGAYSLQTVTVSGSDYPDDETWQGLFGQSFADAGRTWPSTYEVKYYQSDGSYITNIINTLWKEPDQGTPGSQDGYIPGTVLVFLDSFILPDPSETTLQLETTSTGNVTVGFYQEDTEGNYPDTPTNDVHTSGGQFLITDKYAGFHATKYRVLRNNSWSEVTLGSPDNEGVYARVPSGYSELRIYYERTLYSIEFVNGAEGEVGTEDKKYGVPLADLETPTVTYPGNPSDAAHYTFVGWFADPDLTTYVFFDRSKVETDWAGLQRDWELNNYTIYDSMPSHNFAVYAGWFKSWFNVRLDSNGGTLPEGQAPSFWVQYGDLIAGSSLNQTTREGYTLIGWRVGSENGDPWDFDNGVTESMTLVAVWRYNHILTVAYDAGDGSDAPSDNAVYDDGASAPVTLDQPTPPEGKFFIGWRLNDRIYYAGDTFVVSSNDAVDDVVTLTAVYAELSTTSITFVPNYPGGPEPIVKDLDINEAVDLSEITFERPHYTLIGWDTDPEATDPAISTTDRVAADNNDPAENILYAIWEEDVVDIEYVVVGPDNTQYTDVNEVGQLTRYIDDDVKVVTGTVDPNVAAPASDLYRFVGWFTDEACAVPAEEASGATLTPAQTDGAWTSRKYYAKFKYNYTTLKITKAGSDPKDPGQAFLFRVRGKSGTNTADIDITVSVKGDDSVTIANLFIGSYTVTEITDWSWRYDYVSATFNGTAVSSNGAEIELSPETNTLVVTNSRINPYWLGGDDYKVNDFTAPAATTGEAILPDPVRIKHDGQPVEA